MRSAFASPPNGSSQEDLTRQRGPMAARLAELSEVLEMRRADVAGYENRIETLDGECGSLRESIEEWREPVSVSGRKDRQAASRPAPRFTRAPQPSKLPCGPPASNSSNCRSKEVALKCADANRNADGKLAQPCLPPLSSRS